MQKNILPPAGFTQKLSASQHYEYNFLPFSCSILRAIQLWQAALVVVLNWSVCSKGLRYNIERMVKWEQWNQTADISWVLCDSAKRIRPSKFTTQLKPASTDGQKEKWQFEWDSHPKKKGGGLTPVFTRSSVNFVCMKQTKTKTSMKLSVMHTG